MRIGTEMSLLSRQHNGSLGSHLCSVLAEKNWANGFGVTLEFGPADQYPTASSVLCEIIRLLRNL